MRVYNHHTGEQLFQADGKTGSFSRQVQIGATNANGQLQQPLYTLKQKRLTFDKTFYAVDDENSGGSEAPVFKALSTGGSFGKAKNDLEVEFCEGPGMPMQKLQLMKTVEVSSREQ